MLPNPEQFDAFLRLGAAGLLAVAVFAFAKGWIRVGSIVDRDKIEVAERHAAELGRADARETRIIGERDRAIALAESYADNFERALDVIEGKAK